jgi:hypothetical protein
MKLISSQETATVKAFKVAIFPILPSVTWNFKFSMRTPFAILILLMTLVLFQACEQEYIPVNSGEGPKYVVEGYVEAGQNPFAPYVILTSSFDFYGSFTPG